MKSFEDVPANRFFGFEPLEAGPQRARLRMAPRPELSQETGVVHGGAIAALADTCAVYALRPGLAAGQNMTSVEFKLNFLAAAAPDGGPLLATAAVVRQGRRIGVCDVEVAQGPRLVAKGLFTYVFLGDDT